MSQTSQPPLYNASSKLPPSRLLTVSRFDPANGYFTRKQLATQQQKLLEQSAIIERAQQSQASQGEATDSSAKQSKPVSQGTGVSPIGGPSVPAALKPSKLPGTGPIPRTSLGMMPKASAWNVNTGIGKFVDNAFLRPINSTLGVTESFEGSQEGGLGQTYGHYVDKFLNPFSSAWNEETTDSTEEALKWGSRAGIASAITAGAGALGLASMPAATGAAATTATSSLPATTGAVSSIAPTAARGVLGTAKNYLGKAWNIANHGFTADWISQMATGKGLTEHLGLGGSKATNAAGGVGGSAAPNMWQIPTYGAERAYGRYNPDNWSSLPTHGFNLSNTKTADTHMPSNHVPVGPLRAAYQLDKEAKGGRTALLSAVGDRLRNMVSTGRAKARGASDSIFGGNTPPATPAATGRTARDQIIFRRQGNRSNNTRPVSPAAARQNATPASPDTGQVSPGPARDIAANWGRQSTGNTYVPKPTGSPGPVIGRNMGGGDWGKIDVSRAAKNIGLVGGGMVGMNVFNNLTSPDTEGMLIDDGYGNKVNPSYFTESTGQWYNPWSWGKSQAMADGQALAAVRRIRPELFNNSNNGNSNNGSDSGSRRTTPSSLYSTVSWPEASYYQDRVRANQGNMK